jgi:predicted Zn-dependent protease
MPNPYLTDEVAELTRSHKQAMQQMKQAATTQGDAGVRAVDLWQQIVALISSEEATEAGMEVYRRASEMWATSKVEEAKGLDALALSLGVTRKDLLDELAALPPTFE